MRLDDLPAQFVVHRNFDDTGCVRRLALKELPPLEELFDGDASNAEGFGQMAIAEASLTRHFPRDNHGTVSLGKEAAPQPAAGNRKKRSRASSGEMHRAGIASDKASRKRYEAQRRQDGRRLPGKIEMNTILRQRSTYPVD